MQKSVIGWLQSQGFRCTRELCSLSYEPMDIVGGRFGERSGRRIPALLEAVAVELKLNNVGGVLWQARRNRICVERSFAAMPATRCARLRAKSISAFVSEGVGLLAVSADDVVVLVPAQPSGGTHERIVKNLWRKLRDESKTSTPR